MHFFKAIIFIVASNMVAALPATDNTTPAFKVVPAPTGSLQAKQQFEDVLKNDAAQETDVLYFQNKSYGGTCAFVAPATNYVCYTIVDTLRGCCAFYDSESCSDADLREHGPDNDKIGSLMCNVDNCNNMPE